MVFVFILNLRNLFKQLNLQFIDIVKYLLKLLVCFPNALSYYAHGVKLININIQEDFKCLCGKKRKAILICDKLALPFIQICITILIPNLTSHFTNFPFHYGALIPISLMKLKQKAETFHLINSVISICIYIILPFATYC